jgi:hypothetical protein
MVRRVILPSDIRYILWEELQKTMRDYRFTMWLLGTTLKQETDNLLAGEDEHARTIVVMVY